MTADRLALRCAILGALAFAGTAGATTISVVNNDGAGEGFNDTSVPAAGIGCQPGDTLGACRLRVFQTAADQWERLLNSNVEILVRAAMDPQTCSQTSAVLGSAGSLSSHSNFANAPRPNIAYPQALANSYAGTDLNASPDIQATFNITLDAGNCLNGTAGWWYNTDPSVPVPNDRTPLLPVVFHEIGHGLGFSSGVNTATGGYISGATPSIWASYLYDVETGKYWKNMTNAERVASSINDPDLVWTGPRTSKLSTKFLGPPAKVTINSPAGIAGNYDAQTAEFGASVATSPVTADVVLVDDGVVGTGTINDGCETPFANAAAVAGKIALIDRGICVFAVKVKNAQLNGAIGVIVANNVAAGFPSMAGADATITIPSLGVTQATGNAIKGSLPAPGVNAKLGQLAGGPLSGTNSGCVRMFAPNPLQSGSSVSHFHSDAFPNLLMEPALNRSIFNKVDLTLPLFADIDWSTNIEDILFVDGFDPSPCAFVQP